ncbi:MAG: hypothetical protein F6K10_43735 [Moorea sp. SIO2B7]|nr:hypothetical protein [Moorena sp. SIO2B7]
MYLENYTIIETLGKGGFGITYLAEDKRKQNNAKCVIKEIIPDPSELEQAKQRFEKEASILQELG